ncbi:MULTISPECIES: hypothetical protein [Chitinophagaceae]
MNIRQITSLFGWIILLATIAIIGNSCKKFSDPPLYFEDYGDDSSALKTRKVLVIGIDGFSGVDFANSTHPYLDSLYAHSKYTMNVLSESYNNDVATWESVMTGKSAVSHQVVDSSFNPTGEMDDPDAAVSTYNSLFFYLTKYKPTVKSLTISSWTTLSNTLFKGSSHRIIANNDQAVADSAVALLPTTLSDVSFLQFNSTALAGQQSGFDIGNSNYTKAITTIDSYVGKIWNAIKSRSTYSQEEWLILVTTNRGPSQLNPNPGFLLAYNKHFIQNEMKLNGQSAPSVSTNNYTYTIPDDGGIYNMGTKSECTIQFSVNVASSGSSLSFPVLLSKKQYVNAGASATGWAFYLGYDKGWSIDFGAKRSSGYRLGGTPYTNTINMRDGTWYTITAVVSSTGGHKYVKGYTYCASKDTFDVGGTTQINDALGDFSTTAPLTIGHILNMASDEGGAGNFAVRNIALFDKALDSATIRNNKCLADYAQHPDASHLIGYWPCNEGGGGVLNNATPVAANAGYNFVQNVDFSSWNILEKAFLPCFLPNTENAAIPYSIVVTNEDLMTNVMQWMRISISSTWGLSGAPWIKNFETEYVLTN